MVSQPRAQLLGPHPGEGSHFFPKFGHLFPKTSYVHIYVIVRHKALIEAFSSHTARASYRQKNHNSIIRAHTHNIHACCIWIHTRWSHHTTSFTACIIHPSYIIQSMSHNDIIQHHNRHVSYKHIFEWFHKVVFFVHFRPGCGSGVHVMYIRVHLEKFLIWHHITKAAFAIIRNHNLSFTLCLIRHHSGCAVHTISFNIIHQRRV